MHRVKGACKAMQLSGLRSSLLLFFAVAIVGAIAGCDNPFDPLKSSDKIQGLSYFDFAATQEHWDSDPEWDGVQITLSYFNEFGDALNFHDKPSKVEIELWQEVSSATTPPVVTQTFLTSLAVSFSNSDDPIRIPIEAYSGFLVIADPPADIKGCLQVRLFPPQEYPQRVLVAPTQCGVDLFKKEEPVLLPP
jgi:hypothetical protein